MSYYHKDLSKKIAVVVVLLSLIVLSYFAGEYLATPLIHALKRVDNNKIESLLAGFLVVGIVFLIYRSFIIFLYNRRQESVALERLPKTFKDVHDLGIKNSVDFCAAMQILFAYPAVPNLGLPSPFLRESQNAVAWDNTLRLFKLLYGRDPYGSDENIAITWAFLAAKEAQRALHKQSLDQITSEEIMQLLSPEIRESFGMTSYDG